jgi:hypothetical protein
VRVTYEPGTPPEVQDAIGPLIERWNWLLPHWTYNLLVSFHENGEEKHSVTLETGGRAEYREAVLKVYAWFFMLGPEERETAVVHEFLHLPWAPYTDAVDALVVRAYHDNEDARHLCLGNLRDRLESAVQDLAWSLTRRSSLGCPE